MITHPTIVTATVLAAWLLACSLAAQSPPDAGQTLSSPAVRALEPGRLAYARLTRSTWQIFETDLATGRSRQITDGIADKRFPSYRPDGSLSWHDVDQRAAVEGPGSAAPVAVLSDLWPVRDLAWSPDRSRMAFTRIRTDLIDAMNLWIADADGRNARTLTTDPGVQCHPAWSPDGRCIAFSTGQGFGSYEICTIGADGKDRKRLTEDRNLDFYPAWSPDGRRIAWSSDRSGDYEIWVMSPDGSDRRRLTESHGLDSRPAWTRDGTSIAFASSRTGSLRIWIMDADGRNQRPLDMVGDDTCDPVFGPARPGVPAGSPPPSVADALPGVGVQPKVVDVGKAERATVTCELARPATVSLDIVDRLGVLVHRIDQTCGEAGPCSISWDGRDFSGRPVASGVYRYVLRVEEETGRVVVHDPVATTGGEEIKPREFTYDAESGRLAWTMPKAGFARLRIGLKSFPHLRTLLDWEPMAAGHQELTWDGLDASGLIQLGKHPDLHILLSLWAMPDNTIIVRGGDAMALRRGARPTHPPMEMGADAYYHARHDPETCHEVRHRLEFPGCHERDDEGRLVLRGRVPVRVILDPRDRVSVLDAKYEVAVYVDLVFLFEEEDGVDPFTFTLDTAQLNPGEHLLTVDVLTYDDHFGVTTERVVVMPPE